VNKNINKNLVNVVFNQLACPECNMKYIRQTGRSFHVRFKVHFCDFKYENAKSKFVQHLLQNKHSTGPMEDLMEILQITRKNRMMNTFERFIIYNEKTLDKSMTSAQ